jgi:uncharacterized glyoxalase superfamily protein PhnB
MPDPFRDLRMPTGPIEPRRAFAAELRRRLELALQDPNQPVEGDVMTTTQFIPERLHAVTPYLAVSDARAAIRFYEEVLGATLVSDPIIMDDDRVGHAELEINGSVVFLADEFPEIGHPSPTAVGATTASFVVYVPDVEAAVARAVAAGATQEQEIDERYGARSAWIVDPFGHRWNIGTAIGA